MDAMKHPESSRDSMLQDVVAGRFRLIEQLGEGAVGDIYLAEHRVLDRKYALKVLKRHFLSNRTVAERFRREALVASRLEHPNIVEISDFGRADNGRLFLAMEYIQGESLGAAIEEHLPGVMPLRRGLRILAQVASAVAAAHDAGVLHRDLKPDNIMLTQVRNTEQVKVLDFGLAKVMVDADSLVLTKRGEMFGTPIYMSPEQALGDEVDSRTDIYAFGVIAYELCTGRAPLEGERLHQLLIAKQTQIPPPPSTVHPLGPAALPAALDKIIGQCLAKDREDRPLRISEVGAVIEQCLARYESRSSPYLDTVKYGKMKLDELVDAASGALKSTVTETAASAEPVVAVGDASIVEIDPWHWREVCSALVGLAHQLKGLGLCPLEVVSLLVSLSDIADRTRTLAMAQDVVVDRLAQVESTHREQTAQLRHAVIDLSLERGRVAEDGDADPQLMVDLDFQIKELEQRLAEIYRHDRAFRAEPEQEVAELETQLEQVRQQQSELEFLLLDHLRTCRPADPPPEITSAYEDLEELLL